MLAPGPGTPCSGGASSVTRAAPLAASASRDAAIEAPYRSSGPSPVRRAIRASMRGPISSPSWNANTTSGHPGRASVRCEPASRVTVQPSRRSAARTRRAFADGR